MIEPLRTSNENRIYGIAFAVLAIIIYIIAFMCPIKSIGFVCLGGLGAFCIFGSVLFFNLKSSDDTDDNNSHRTISNPVNFTTGILIIIGCIVLYNWSTDWEWVSRSRTNIYIVHDESWFKYVYYPILVIAGLIGLKLIQKSFNDED